ncbi:hypothetical protein MSAN_01893900 [Mycena sanguinolenta]|uniref:F-box domain-containing protein n=1 Tax=Mycena sanguinolenta TaxID=230812 RepID=A0A8H7CR54_9AGAR|nr:hypothetical protein MSAN_01893900 [Mycena sanguinolenta]
MTKPNAPALRLPFELTSKTFCLCLPRHGRVRPRRNGPPLQMAQVCRQWRDVALATPELWRSIDFEFSVEELRYDGLPTLFGQPEKEFMQWNPAAILDLWLTRSSQLPISVSMCCYDFLPSSMIPLLASHSRRWEHLELKLHRNDFRELAQTPGPFPLLRGLFIRVLGDPRPVEIRDFLRNIPMLAKLDIRDRFVQEVLLAMCPLIALNLDHEGHVSGTSRWNDVFKAFPKLRHFGAYGVNPHTSLTHESLRPLTRVPPLSTLILNGGPQFLHTLTIPTLRHLSVQLFGSTSAPYTPGFALHVQEFILRSGCLLDILTIAVTESPENSDVSGELALFLAVPTLCTLELQLWRPHTEESHASSDARYRLLRTPGILPELKNLIITDMDSFSTPAAYNTFIDIVCSRHALRSAELHIFPRNFHRHDIVPSLPHGL